MPFKRYLPGALALAIGSASLPAQSVNFWTQCTTGAFHACASVQVSLIYHPAGTFNGFGFTDLTEVRIQLTNLQGAGGGNADSPFGLHEISLSGLRSRDNEGTDGGFPTQVASAGSAVIGAPLDLFSVSYLGNGAASASFHFDFFTHLFGCDLPVGTPPLHGYDATCGHKSSITYSALWIQDELTFGDQASIGLNWRTWNEGDDFDNPTGTASCRSGVDCVTVTPEPASVALLLTGLAGVAAAHRRRRQHRA